MCPLYKILCVLSIILYVSALCPFGYTSYKRQACFRFKYYEYDSKTIAEAQALCKNYSNGTLASIDNANQEKFLTDIFMYDQRAHYTVWIGLKRNPNNIEQFIWGDGSNSTYTHWEPGEPNMFEGKAENCVHFDVKTDDKGVKHNGWNDEPCDSTQVYGFICRVPYETLNDIERKYVSEQRPGLASSTGVAVGCTIGIILFLAFVALVGYVGFRKFINKSSTIPMVQLKNEPV